MTVSYFARNGKIDLICIDLPFDSKADYRVKVNSLGMDTELANNRTDSN